MRRVFAVVGFSFVIMSVISLEFGITFSVIASIVSATVFAAALFVNKLRRIRAIPLVLACISLASLNCARYMYFEYKPAAELDGRRMRITAHTLGYGKETANGYKYTFKCDKTDDEGTKQNFKFAVYTDGELNLRPYDGIVVETSLSKDYCSKNFDYGNGIFLSAYLRSDGEYEIFRRGNPPIMCYFAEAQKYFSDSLDKYMSADSAGLAKGFLFSDKSQIPDDTYSAFRECGLSHTVAVSGMHISILCGAMFYFLRLLGVGRRKSSAVGIVFILCYLLTVGFHYSAVRAGIMTIIMLVGGIIGRKSDALNSLGAACFIFSLMNPFSAVNAAFLLSLSATLGMVIMYKPVSDRLSGLLVGKMPRAGRICTAILSPLIQSVCAGLFILPAVYMFFGRTSVISPIVNMAVIPLISAATVLSLICALTAFLPLIPNIFGFFGSLSAELIMKIVRGFSKSAVTDISINERYIGLWIAATLVLISVALIYASLDRVKSRAAAFRVTACLSAIMLAVFALCDSVVMKNVVSVTVIDSNDGICAALNVNGTAYFIGAGGSSADYGAQQYVYKNGIKNVGALILPSSDKEYAADAVYLAKKLAPQNIIMPTDDKYYEVKAVASDAEFYDVDLCRVKLGDDIYISKTGGAVYLEIGNTDILFADESADISRFTAGAEYVSAVVICGMPPDGVQNIHAGCAVISAENTKYAYRLVENGVKTYSTCENGNVEIITRGGEDINVRRG